MSLWYRRTDSVNQRGNASVEQGEIEGFTDGVEGDALLRAIYAGTAKDFYIRIGR